MKVGDRVIHKMTRKVGTVIAFDGKEGSVATPVNSVRKVDG